MGWNTVLTELENRFGVLENRFGILENRQSNFEIATINARLFAVDGAGGLQPPLDVQSGDAIPDFPVTLPQLYELDEQRTDAVLAALGLHLSPNIPLSIKRESIARNGF